MAKKEYLPKAGDLEGLQTHVMEECAEVIIAITKAKRFGYFNTHPRTGQQNWVCIFEELLDLKRSIRRYEKALKNNLKRS